MGNRKNKSKKKRKKEANWPRNENTSPKAKKQAKRSGEDFPSLVGSDTEALRHRWLEIRWRSKSYRWWWWGGKSLVFGGSSKRRRGFRGACWCSNGGGDLGYFAVREWPQKWDWWWKVESCGHGFFCFAVRPKKSGGRSEWMFFGGLCLDIYNLCRWFNNFNLALHVSEDVCPCTWYWLWHDHSTRGLICAEGLTFFFLFFSYHIKWYNCWLDNEW